MFKIFYTMPCLSGKLNSSNNQNFGNVEIKRGKFPGEFLPSLLLTIGLILLTFILRKCKEAYELSNSKKRINQLLDMDDLKSYEKTDKGLGSMTQPVTIFSSDICMEFGNEKCNIPVLKKIKTV